MRTNFWRHATGAGLVALVLALATPAHADLKDVMDMQMAAPPGGAAQALGGMRPSMQMTTYVKGTRQRIETAIQFGPMKMHTVTLTLCDKHQVIQLDPDLKLYTINSTFLPLLGGAADAMIQRQNAQAHPGAAAGKTGSVASTFSVKDLGAEKVAGFDTRHYAITDHMVYSGCVGAKDTTFKMETWVAPGKGGLVCPDMFQPTRVVKTPDGCEVTYSVKGDLAALKAMTGSMPVQTKVYNGDTVMLTAHVTSYSADPLPDALFTLPADYKSVSNAEFQDAKRKAMMGAFMGNLHVPGGVSGPGGIRKQP